MREQKFFLAYHGKGGFTLADADKMPLGELQWNCRKLFDQLTEEKRAHDAAIAKAKSKAKGK